MHNTLLTAQENDNYIQSKSQLLKSEAYYLNEKEVISSQEKNFNAESLKSAIKGIKYAIIELTALEQEKADKIIYVTDAGQALHFRMVFACAEKAGYLTKDV